MTTPDQQQVDGYAPPPLRPGWRTTEFWLTVIGSALSLLVGFHLVGPDFAKAHESQVNALAFFAATIAPGMYAVARGITKHGHQQAVATVLAASLSTGRPAIAAVPVKPARHRRAAGDGGAVDKRLLIAGIVVAALVLGFGVSWWFLLLLLVVLVLVRG